LGLNRPQKVEVLAPTQPDFVCRSQPRSDHTAESALGKRPIDEVVDNHGTPLGRVGQIEPSDGVGKKGIEHFDGMN